MLTNLLRPWILARLLSGTAALALTIIGVLVAWRVLRYWRVGATSEGQLALERRAELVAALVQVALGISLANVALTVLSADRLTHSIRGAMCAWGVFDASPWGFTALATSGAAAAACAFWVVLHRLDLQLAKPTLTKRKFVALFLVVPLIALDLGVTTRWVLDLDMQVVASCCSVGLDDALGASESGTGGPRAWAAWIALAVASVAALLSFASWRRPSRAVAMVTALCSAAAGVLALPAILGYVAPHAYESPHHLCPFCLLHADVWGLGWPLFGFLFAAAVTGTAIGMVELQRSASGEPDQISQLERQLGAWAGTCWTLTILLAALPVVRYAVVTGGASLFP